MAEIEFLDEVAIDDDAAAPHGQPCEACGCPLEPQDKFCPACGTVHEGASASIVTATVVPTASVEAVAVDDASQDGFSDAKPASEAKPKDQKFFRCDNCAAEIGAEGEQRSFVCPFCDSTYVSEFSPASSGRQEPEFVIGFVITPEQAHAKFRAWISENSMFRPGDLKSATIQDKLKGVYLPFWSFSMLAESSWDANIGEYWYRTETYVSRDSKGNMVTKTRRVRETEWWPLNGRHHRYYSGYLVSGSKGLAQDQAERIKPFNLPALKRFEPMYLAGWMSEEYSIARDDALKHCQQEFYSREQRNVATFLPGDTQRGLTVSTSFSDVNSDLCLLPMYILSYRYGDTLYRFLVNGQTGRCAGDKPLSWKRIGLFSLGVVALILAVVAIVVVVSNG
jgi:predicted RNA-binding Zn-ribbon protein involved in translation (DUF1610 family)